MGPLWGLWRVRQAGAMMSSGNQKISIIAVTLGALALCAVLVSVHQEGASEAVREQAAIAEKVPEAETEADFIQAGAQDKTAPASSEEAADDSKPIKGEDTLRHRIHKAIQVASDAMAKAHTKEEKAKAKTAVKAALADAGVADADNAGTIAWAERNLKVAKAWAVAALKHDAESLSKVEAWTEGD